MLDKCEVVPDKWLGDIPDRYKDTTPAKVKVDYVNEAEKRLDWGDFAGVEQLQAALQPRMDSAASMAAAWEGYLLSECLRLGCWRIWLVQTTIWSENRVDTYTKVFPPWAIAEAQKLAKSLGEHIVGLSLKRWLLMPFEQFVAESRSSPNFGVMREMRRVLGDRCRRKCR